MTRRATGVRSLTNGNRQVRSRDSSAAPSSTPRLTRIAHATLHEKVYDELRNALMSGAFVPGETLTIRGVADALGTSVMPVREALHRLSAEGGVEILANRTIRVPTLDAANFDELIQMRLLLEGRATSIAAAQITRAELDEAKRHNRDFANSRDGDHSTARLMANRRFHFTIYQAARAPLLLSIIEMMWLQSGPYLMAPMRWPASRDAGNAYFAGGVSHHDAIVDALGRHDGAAASAAVQADITDAANAYRDVQAQRAAGH